MMATRKIEIDDEVFAALEREARPFIDKTPNDVLRRLLLGDQASSTGPAGALQPYIQAGQLHAGDALVHEQPRKRRRFTATVTADGHIEIGDGRRFAEPSPALGACVGTAVNGWKHWIVERTGIPLGDLRSL